MFIEDAMLIDFEEWYMLRNNLKSYGQQIQSMFKTNKINKAKQNQNQRQHKQTQMKKNTCELKSLTTKKNTTYVDVHPGPGKELVCTFCGVKQVT